LQAKLLAEANGIFSWGVEGCLAWQREGLNPPKPVLDATDEYFEAEDALGRWLEERCVRPDRRRDRIGRLDAGLPGSGGDSAAGRGVVMIESETLPDESA